MSAICGCFGPMPSGRRDSIDRQIGALFPSRGAKRCVRSPRGTVAAVGSAADVAERDGIIVAVSGSPAAASARDEPLGAERLLDLYRASGTGLGASLTGRFALVVLDDANDLALLATDRLGREPLAYALGSDGTLVFGSTATSIAAHDSIGADIDAQAILAYLYFHVIPSPATVFRGVQKLQPAQQLVLRRGASETSRYWSPTFTHETRAEPQALAREVRELVRAAVARHAANPATGAFLSGGIDSSTVSGMLRALRDEPIKCFTIGFDSKGYDELEFARIASEHFGNELIHYYVTPADVVASMAEIAAAYDEPFGNASAIPALYCARLAREHGIDHLLAGDGGDELFAGNERYRKQLAFNWYHRLPAPLRSLADRLADRSPGPSARGLRRLQFYLEKSRAALPQRLHLANFVTATGPAAIFTPAFLDAVDTSRPAADLEDWYADAPDGPPLSHMLYLDWKLTLADNDLRKVNRMCELAGVAVSYPLIDDALVEFSTGLSDEVLMPGLRLRHFFKQSMRGFLPDAVIDKSKHGFGLPFGQWLLDDAALARTVADALDSLGNRGLVSDAFVGRLRAAHRDEHAAYYGTQIWVLVMLELWLAHHAPQTRW